MTFSSGREECDRRACINEKPANTLESMKPTKQGNQASKKGREGAANESAANASAANASAANASAANESAANESAANESAANESAANESAANESASNASAANESAANASAANESAVNDLFIWIGGPSVSASFSSNLSDTGFRDGSCIMPMAVEVLNTCQSACQ
jgi:membrane protein involved in colicin uptake